MKIYLAHTAIVNKKDKKRVSLVTRTLKKLGQKVLERSGKTRKIPPSGLVLFPDFIFEEERKLIRDSDVMVVEATATDFQTGFLTTEALRAKKPVLALFYKDSAEKLSPLLRGNPELFIEHYSEDDIKIILKRFLDFLEKRKKKKGKLVVIDGTDGSGKKTQCELLLRFLRNNNYKTKFIDFPRYYSSFQGKMVGRFLRGEFGGIEEVSPYLASLAYALDRLSTREEIEEWLRTDNIVVANRYTSSSMAHQTAKLPKRKQSAFLKWLYEMEYKLHKLPKEDITIFLYVPVEIGQKLVDKKEKRGYRGRRKRDIHERDLTHLKAASEIYLRLAKKFKHWVKIDCCDRKGNLQTPEEIHEKILGVLKKRKII